MKRIWCFLGLLFLLVGAFTHASAKLAWDPKEFMGVDEIHPGMTGYGKTVYSGTKVETFNVEVIGVLQRIDFGFDMILIKVTSGPVVDRKLQTVEGMSGSPIYIDGRLIGAYAYGWNFQQEPVAGVTPIAAMLECTEPGSAIPLLAGTLKPADQVLAIGDRLITRVKIAANHSAAEQLEAQNDPTTMVLTPVTTPLFVSGMPDSALKPLQKLLDRYNVRALPGVSRDGVGAGKMDGPTPPIEAGSAVAVSLMEGDANMSAVGTVTYVKDDTILVFGHPFLGSGKTNLPMSLAYINGVVSSASSSFKVGSPIGQVGTALSDRTFAVSGTLGQKPDTLESLLFLKDDSRNYTRRYSVNVANNPDLTPFILYLMLLTNGASQMGNLQWDEGTFTTHTVVSTERFGDLKQDFTVAPSASNGMPMLDFLKLVDSLMTNPYEKVKLNRIFIDMHYAPERNIATVEQVIPDRTVARPGETVTLSVHIRPYGKPVETRQVQIKVPANTTDSVMLVLVAGGVHGPILKPLLSPPPTPEEGTEGLVRWFTATQGNPKNLLALQVFPSPSYGYRGQLLHDLPSPVLDMLRVADSDTGMTPDDISGDSGRGGEHPNESLPSGVPPTAYLTTLDVPYVLAGGQIVPIAIATDDQVVQSRPSGFDPSRISPVLSASINATQRGGDNGPGERTVDDYTSSPWLTAQQRARFTLFTQNLDIAPAQANPLLLTIPMLHLPALGDLHPLSLAMLDTAGNNGEVDVDAVPDGPGSSGEKPGASPAGNSNDDNEPPSERPGENSSHDSHGTGGILLTHQRPNWVLMNAQDFIRGKHLGTSVTSTGALVLSPMVHAVYQTSEMVPWRMVSTTTATYVAGWKSNQIVRIAADGASEVIFPKEAMSAIKAITALTTDADGNILAASWPDSHVRLLKPDGTLLREWTLPAAVIWDLAVTGDGRRFAGCNGGMLYILRDDADVPLQVGCQAPDKNIYAMTVAPSGDLYFATAPRGKIYHFTRTDQLDAVFDGHGTIASLAVDRKGNVYAGMSSTCRILRIAPDGSQHEVMRGMSRRNRHVLAMKLIGDDLFATTGPAGGIYRVIDPASAEPEVAVVFAREDQRAGTNENDPVGGESVMVTALAVSPNNELLIAAASPGQVLKLMPRTSGTFYSTILTAPSVAKWGQLDAHTRVEKGQSVAIETRSGRTALPDQSWSDWAPVDAHTMQVGSDANVYAQFRITMASATGLTPQLDYLRLYFQPVNQAPVVKLFSPHAGQYQSGRMELRWNGRDPDGDELIYRLYVSKDDGATWSPLDKGLSLRTPALSDDETPPAPKKGKERKTKPGKEKPPEAAAVLDKSIIGQELRVTNVSWDTKAMEDGHYRIKVVASDKYAHPTDAKSDEAISGSFIIDNTPPRIDLPDKILGWTMIEHVVISGHLSPIVGGRFRIDKLPWVALTPDNGVFSGTKVAVYLTTPAGPVERLPRGDHTVDIQAVDAAGNKLERTFKISPYLKSTILSPAPTTKPSGEGDSKGLTDLLLYPIEQEKKDK